MSNVPFYFTFPVTTSNWTGTWGTPIVYTPISPPIPQLNPKQQKVKHGNIEGYECSECKDFSPMAELNMPEGSEDCDKFSCYVCRKGLRTLF